MAAKTGIRKKSLAAFGASLALNLAFLAAMVFGVRALPPPPETPAVQLTLLPPLPFILTPRADRPTSATKAPGPAKPMLKVLTRPPETPAATGAPSGPVPVPAQIAAPPAPPAQPQGGDTQGLLKESVGCDDPDAFHLTKAQRAVCDERLATHAKAAPNLAGLKMDPGKLADFDRATRCREANRGGAMPAPGDHTEGVTGITGLGESDMQRLRDCPPGDR